MKKIFTNIDNAQPALAATRSRTYLASAPSLRISGGYYAIKGVFFFLAHPSLWMSLITPMIITATFSIISVILLFVFALSPQSIFLQNYMAAWIAWTLAVILVLLEVMISITVFALILFNLFRTKLFIEVLQLNGLDIEDRSSMARSVWNASIMSIIELLVLIISLPLNLIPIIGTVLYYCLNGFMLSWNIHSNYFELKNVPISIQYKFMNKYWTDYLSFGVVCLLLSSIPFVGFFFFYTNIVGAVLWVI
eukprot:TRINITY_DN5380_c0_g1_i1.p1 TRINITY_DN5380_c0_g1~~TRINITY_DN5380_c0_g1_i1.p1  ORF type:complete len:250 (+),score=106.47 TRINITY_DN5380_c0_g1_i1:117-866(+)